MNIRYRPPDFLFKVHEMLVLLLLQLMLTMCDVKGIQCSMRVHEHSLLLMYPGCLGNFVKRSTKWLHERVFFMLLTFWFLKNTLITKT